MKEIILLLSKLFVIETPPMGLSTSKMPDPNVFNNGWWGSKLLTRTNTR
jgi:hypothetical protein